MQCNRPPHFLQPCGCSGGPNPPLPPPILTQCCSPIAGRKRRIGGGGEGGKSHSTAPGSEHHQGVGSCPAPFARCWLQSAGAEGGDSVGTLPDPILPVQWGISLHHPPHHLVNDAQNVSPPPPPPTPFLWGHIPMARCPHGCGVAVLSAALFARCVPAALSRLARRLRELLWPESDVSAPPFPPQIAVPQFPL